DPRADPRRGPAARRRRPDHVLDRRAGEARLGDGRGHRPGPARGAARGRRRPPGDDRLRGRAAGRRHDGLLRPLRLRDQRQGLGDHRLRRGGRHRLHAAEPPQLLRLHRGGPDHRRDLRGRPRDRRALRVGEVAADMSRPAATYRVPPTPPHVRRGRVLAVSLAVLALALLVVVLATMNLPTWERVRSGLTRTLPPLWRGFTHPDWEVFPFAFRAMLETLFMAVLGTLLGGVLAFGLSFLAARNLL